MLARVKAVLRRTGAYKEDDVIEIGKLKINIPAHKVTVDGEEVGLTLKEFELLQAFMQKPEYVFTRERLLSSIWGISYVGETRTVDVHIGTLRTKLMDCGSYIETVRGVGYRMNRGIAR
jgi:two-component system alkaline phosphatase synthesis response regulator PhoP